MESRSACGQPRPTLRRAGYPRSHTARQMRSRGGRFALPPAAPGQACLPPRPGGCHLGDPLPSAGPQPQPAVSTRGHSGIGDRRQGCLAPAGTAAPPPRAGLSTPAAPGAPFPTRRPLARRKRGPVKAGGGSWRGPDQPGRQLRQPGDLAVALGERSGARRSSSQRKGRCSTSQSPRCVSCLVGW